MATNFTYKMRSGGKGMWGPGPAPYKHNYYKKNIWASNYHSMHHRNYTLFFLLHCCKSVSSSPHYYREYPTGSGLHPGSMVLTRLSDVKSSKRVRFCTEVETFHHRPENELDLIRYRNRNRVSWPSSFPYRYKQLLEPVLRPAFQEQIIPRNLLAEAVYSLEQQTWQCKAAGTIEPWVYLRILVPLGTIPYIMGIGGTWGQKPGH